MPPKKRGRPAKKPAQPAASEAPATPAATVRMSPLGSPIHASPIHASPIPSEVAEAPNIAKKRPRDSESIVIGDIESIAAEDEPPRKKRGRPRKQQPAALVLASARSISVIGDSEEDVDVGGIGGDMRQAAADGFTQELKDVMREIFIGNAIEQGGGLWIPRDAALQMAEVFAPMLSLPFGDVFVPAKLVESIREQLTPKTN